MCQKLGVGTEILVWGRLQVPCTVLPSLNSAVFLPGMQRQVWSWGRNREGQLGRVSSERDCDPRPAPIAELRDVVRVTGSGVAAFALTASGEVWSWGYSKRGQLGQGRGVLSSPEPRRVLGIPGPVRHMAAGWGHALALLSECEAVVDGMSAGLLCGSGKTEKGRHRMHQQPDSYTRSLLLPSDPLLSLPPPHKHQAMTACTVGGGRGTGGWGTVHLPGKTRRLKLR